MRLLPLFLAISLLGLVNQERQAEGLPQLIADPSLEAIAEAHSQAMAAEGTLWHPAGLNSLVGKGPDEVSVLTSLMESVPQRYMVLGDYSHVGIGVAQSGGTVYLTLVFALVPTTTTTSPPVSTTTVANPGVQPSNEIILEVWASTPLVFYLCERGRCAY